MSKPWPMVKLGEVLRHTPRPVDVKADEKYRQIGIRSHGKGVFHKEAVSGFELGSKKVFWMEPGDFVINIVFGWEGAVAVLGKAESGMIASHRFPTFRADESRLDVRFLLNYCKTHAGLDLLGRVSPGGAGRNRTLSKTAFLQQPIPLPPLTEQGRIVARIEELAAQIHEAQRLRKEAAEDAGIFFYASLKQTRTLLLSSAHPKTNLGVLTKVTAGGTPSRDDAAFWNGDVPWIKTGELLDGDIRKAAEYITRLAVENSSAKIFPKETVLIALYGQGQTRGRTGRLLISAATNQACCAVLPKPEKFESRFIQYWLRSLYFELREEAQGGAQPNWNGTMIKALKIALPPLPEQRGIVAELDALQAEVDGLKRLQAETAAELDALLPAILDRAFKGEL